MGDFRAIGATTYLCPVPAVLVGCADARGEHANLIAVAWSGVVCTKPPTLSISLKPERFSHGLISETREFTVNLIGEPLCRALDACGVKSGRDVDKFALLGLHPQSAPPLTCAPMLAEAPAALACRVTQIVPLGSHDLFIAEIQQVYVRDAYFTPSGAIDERAMRLVAYVHGKYRALGDELGFFGWSVAGKDALRRRAPRKTDK